VKRLFLRNRLGDDLYINVGCGAYPLTGFLNIDIGRGADLRWDVRRGLPFPDGSVSGIFSEHFLEHLTQGDGLFFLRECRRVLKPGGLVRVAMPDLDAIVARYGAEDWRGDGDMFRRGFDWVQNRCEMLNIAMREWGHQWLYNEEELLRAGRMAGLVPLGRFERGESDIARFRGVEHRNGSKLVMQFASRERGAESERPAVSVLIPAYRPTFLEEALASVKAQTYPASEVIVCDDSQGTEVEQLVARFAAEGLPCRYYRNEPPRGGMLNYQRCLDMASGEFIKFLNDDDVLEPKCLERMTPVLASDPRVTLVTSQRTRVDERGELLPRKGMAQIELPEDAVLEGGRLIRYVAERRLNLIGEPSTVLFRRRDVEDITPHSLAFGGAEYRGMGDVALWANLLSRGDAAYLREPLSRFRIHGGQRQREPEIRAAGPRSWRMLPRHLSRLGLRRGILSPGIVWRPLGQLTWRRVPGSRFAALSRRGLNFVRDIRTRLADRRAARG